MLKEMVAKTRECGPLQTSPQHERGKLEHFGALLPWVMSKLVLIQSSIAQLWLSFQTCWCTGMGWSRGETPLAGANRQVCLPAAIRRSLCTLAQGEGDSSQQQPSADSQSLQGDSAEPSLHASSQLVPWANLSS